MAVSPNTSGRSDLARLGVWALALGPLALLLGALGFEHWGGLPPCHLCLLQRGPLLVGAILGGMALAIQGAPGTASGLRHLVLLAGVILAVGAGIAVYHAGVERGFFPAPVTCTGELGALPLTPEALAAARAATTIPRCDVVPWRLFGLSLAEYNIFASGALSALAMWMATRAKGRAS